MSCLKQYADVNMIRKVIQETILGNNKIKKIWTAYDNNIWRAHFCVVAVIAAAANTAPWEFYCSCVFTARCSRSKHSRSGSIDFSILQDRLYIKNKTIMFSYIINITALHI